MQQQSSTAPHSAAGIGSAALGVQPPITPASPWSVTLLEVLPGYRLKVTFRDSVSGIVDMSALVNSDTAGVFARLRDEALFQQACVLYGAVTWPEQSGHPALDLAPDAMHAAISKSGVWTL